jgi:altered-inheritance-of-mitochondria protein 13
VTAELERIRKEEAARLAQYTERLTPSSDEQPSSSDDSSLKDKLTSALTPSSSQSKSRSNDTVSKEVAELRSKLERRKGVENKTDASLEKAKEGLVQCLRLNDRRPLDCWEQVEQFKAEVAKLEQKFVDRALR